MTEPLADKAAIACVDSTGLLKMKIPPELPPAGMRRPAASLLRPA